jgi:flagellar motor protein MotB
MTGLQVARRRRHTDDEFESPAWPGLLDLFAFGMVVMLLLWIQSLPEPVGPRPDPRQLGLDRFRGSFGDGEIRSSDFTWDAQSFTLRLVRFGNQEIFFPSARFDLTAADVEAIRRVAGELSGKLAQFPQVVIVVNGTADPIPLRSQHPPRDNVELSALRAAVVSRTLVETGLNGRFQVVGLGEVGLASEHSDAMKAYRRVFLELRWVEPSKEAGS